MIADRFSVWSAAYAAALAGAVRKYGVVESGPDYERMRLFCEKAATDAAAVFAAWAGDEQ